MLQLIPKPLIDGNRCARTQPLKEHRIQLIFHPSSLVVADQLPHVLTRCAVAHFRFVLPQIASALPAAKHSLTSYLNHTELADSVNYCQSSEPHNRTSFRSQPAGNTIQAVHKDRGKPTCKRPWNRTEKRHAEASCPRKWSQCCSARAIGIGAESSTSPSNSLRSAQAAQARHQRASNSPILPGRSESVVRGSLEVRRVQGKGSPGRRILSTSEDRNNSRAIKLYSTNEASPAGLPAHCFRLRRKTLPRKKWGKSSASPTHKFHRMQRVSPPSSLSRTSKKIATTPSCCSSTPPQNPSASSFETAAASPRPAGPRTANASRF